MTTIKHILLAFFVPLCAPLFGTESWPDPVAKDDQHDGHKVVLTPRVW